MREFAAMIFNVALVIALGLLTIRAASVVSAGPPESPVKLTSGTETLWTNEPTRIVQQRTDLERLPIPPDPYPLKMRADQRFKVTANNSFTFDGASFVVAGIDPVARNTICVDDQGRRFACGLNDFKRFQNRVRGRFLECRVVEELEQGKAVSCVVNGNELADMLKPNLKSMPLNAITISTK